MNFDQPQQRSRAELVRDLDSQDEATIVNALIAAALYDHERAFVEQQIVRFLGHGNSSVRGGAAIATGHVARIHRELDVRRILPLIERLLVNPETNAKAQDALEDIQMFVGLPRERKPNVS